MSLFKSCLALAMSSLIVSGGAYADTHVRGYTKSNGTYVQPHIRSSPDHRTDNNWSTKGNTNPHTGETGSKSYDGYRSPLGRPIGSN